MKHIEKSQFQIILEKLEISQSKNNTNSNGPYHLRPIPNNDLSSGREGIKNHSSQIMRRESTLDYQLTTTIPPLLKTEISESSQPDSDLRILSVAWQLYIYIQEDTICDLLYREEIETETWLLRRSQRL